MDYKKYLTEEWKKKKFHEKGKISIQGWFLDLLYNDYYKKLNSLEVKVMNL